MVVGVHCSMSSVRSRTNLLKKWTTRFIYCSKIWRCLPPKFDIFFSNSSKKFTFHIFCSRFDILVDNTVSKFYSESVTLHVIRHSSLLVSCKFRFFNFRHGGSSEMVISHRRFAKNGKETYRNKKARAKGRAELLFGFIKYAKIVALSLPSHCRSEKSLFTFLVQVIT